MLAVLDEAANVCRWRELPNLIAWTRHSHRWSVLVVRVDDTGGGHTVQNWLPLERLRPVRSNPNRVLNYSGFSERSSGLAVSAASAV